MSLDQAITFTLRAEGKYTPIDGGTMCGVTQAVYDAYRTHLDLPTQSAGLISMGDVQIIMHQEYWLPAGCDWMGTRMGVAHFDWAFNHGVSGAIKTLQNVLQVTPDGMIGSETKRAFFAAEQENLIGNYLNARRAWYRADTAQAEYLKGWLARVDALEKYLRTL